MIVDVNIVGFINWWLNEVYKIGRQMMLYLDAIKIGNTMTLLDFTITIVIIGMFLTIILTLPQNVNRLESKAERKRERAERRKNDK